MHLARLPLLGNLFFRDALFRIKKEGKKDIYLTFDDGPIPEATPMVLDILQKYNVKATFFCVGENVEKYPRIFQRILSEGHRVGNHTFNHLNGWKTEDETYLDNISQCSKLVESGLFRPPYGRIKYSQYREVKKKYRVVMWDVLSGDYDLSLSAGQCLDIVKKHARPGSVIIFHDSTKAVPKIPFLLPQALEFMKEKGFEAELLPLSF